MSTYDEWPRPHQDAHPLAIVHAIGQLIINWNDAEHALQRLATTVFKLGDPQGVALLAQIGSQTLCDAIGAALPFDGFHRETRKHVSDGLRWFVAMRGYRNRYAHGVYVPRASENVSRVAANSRNGTLKFTEEPISLLAIRELAEETYDLSLYLRAACDQLEQWPPHFPGTRKYLPRLASGASQPVLVADASPSA